MIDALQASLRVASSGLAAQSARLRVISENMANVQSTSPVPGGDPYRRKTITFEGALDRASGMNLVQVRDVGTDPTELLTEQDPGNPAGRPGRDVGPGEPADRPGGARQERRRLPGSHAHVDLKGPAR